MVTITEKAASKVKEIAAEEGFENKHLRVNILPQGCAGFSFDLFFEDGEPHEDDVVYEASDIKIAINQITNLYLEGTEIQYVDSLFGAGFKFFNPEFSSLCGCGKSFQY